MKFPLHTTQRIAVFRALQLGDMLCAVPALRALRAAYPTAQITLLGLGWAASFCERFSGYIDHFLHFTGFPGLPEQPFDQCAWDDFVMQMRAEPFDLILQMQGNGSIVNAMLKSLNAGPVAGFHNDEYTSEGYLFLRYPTGISEIRRHIMLMEFLGIPSQGLELEYPVAEKERRSLYTRHPFVMNGNYVCVHPGSRGPWRQWPPEHFATLADQCASNGYQVILTGTQEEAPVTRQVLQRMRHPATDLTGQTSLGEIGALIRGARLLISNCTGVSHIAAALGTRSIVISMDGEPERWAPLDTDLHITVDWTRIPDLHTVVQNLNQLMNKDQNASGKGWNHTYWPTV